MCNYFILIPIDVRSFKLIEGQIQELQGGYQILPPLAENDQKSPGRIGLSQFDNKKPEELESEFDYFDVDNSYPTLWIWISCTNIYLMGIKLSKPHYP